MGAVVLDVREADPKFKYLVKKLPGADKLTLCFQCGSCTPDCPVARRREDFRPRRIARLAILGLKKPLFSDSLLWLCLGCFSCTENCPQGVKPTELIEALRELGASEGLLPEQVRDMMEALLRDGRIHRMTRMKARAREKMGLPPVPELDLEGLRALLEASGLADAIRRGRGGGGGK
ncbi:hypothetical protein DRO32_01535 [Candidatus Bathyarchaeota archaeon]|nr:MAG: hypothetical protein DRO32_01535 [Candidatus Bathyarchaeota archaeon]